MAEAVKAPTALVVDASVAAKWHLQDEEYAAEALALLTRYVNGEIELVAPDQIRYEVPSTITVATLGRSPRLTRSVAEAAIAQFLALGLTTVNTDALIQAAFPLVHHHTIAFYDALYLALSHALTIPFITADRKLYQRLTAQPQVIWIGDYHA